LSDPPEWLEWRGEGRQAQTHRGHATPREKRRGENGMEEKRLRRRSPRSRAPHLAPKSENEEREDYCLIAARRPQNKPKRGTRRTMPAARRRAPNADGHDKNNKKQIPPQAAHSERHYCAHDMSAKRAHARTGRVFVEMSAAAHGGHAAQARYTTPNTARRRVAPERAGARDRHADQARPRPRETPSTQRATATLSPSLRPRTL
jgi:hypothetical protein